MDLFTQIKMAVSMKEAAEYYGLEVNRGNMICCPFHADRTPSMKLNEDYFYCFGCGAHGDVINLAARLFGLSGYDAAKKLAYDFWIDPDKPPAAISAGKDVSERNAALPAGIVRLSAPFGALEGAVRAQNAGGYR